MLIPGRSGNKVLGKKDCRRKGRDTWRARVKKLGNILFKRKNTFEVQVGEKGGLNQEEIVCGLLPSLA